jgi:hypothetical protein
LIPGTAVKLAFAGSKADCPQVESPFEIRYHAIPQVLAPELWQPG